MVVKGGFQEASQERIPVHIEQRYTGCMMKREFAEQPWVPHGPGPDITFVNANAIGVDASKIIPPSSVRVTSGLAVDDDYAAPPGSTVVDLRGQYICPGLIDCHVRLTATPDLAYRASYVARGMLPCNFATARDTGGADAALRDALSQTGSHGDLWAKYQGDEHKCCGGHSPSLARVCDGIFECLNAVHDELRQCADFIKIMWWWWFHGGRNPIDHDNCRVLWKICYRHGIEHGNFIDRETAEYYTDKRPAFSHFLGRFSQEKYREVLKGGLDALATLPAVLSADEFLQSATVNATKYIKGKLGCIRKGSIADLLILKTNPSEDITILNRIEDSLIGLLKDERGCS
ncbi:hypothetical protein BDV18DRAFT_154929 [Aspergillus unguis]